MQPAPGRAARWPGAFAGAVLLAGLVGGVAGVSLALLLHAIQHLAYGYSLHAVLGGESFLDGVSAATPLRRLVVLTACGAVAGFGWWLLRRYGRRLISVDTGARPHRSSTGLRCIAMHVCIVRGRA